MLLVRAHRTKTEAGRESSAGKGEARACQWDEGQEVSSFLHSLHWAGLLGQVLALESEDSPAGPALR